MSISREILLELFREQILTTINQDILQTHSSHSISGLRLNCVIMQKFQPAQFGRTGLLPASVIPMEIQESFPLSNSFLPGAIIVSVLSAAAQLARALTRRLFRSIFFPINQATLNWNLTLS